MQYRRCVVDGQGKTASRARTDVPAQVGAATDPRRHQRQRTRNAVVAAATQILQSGREPTVAEAAAAAEVSRATAYRYFPTQDDLVSEAVLELTLGTTGLLPIAGLVDAIHSIADTTVDDVERVVAVVRSCAEYSWDQQHWLRRNLRSSLANASPDEHGYRRPGHRREWIERSTEPLASKVSADDLARLNAALVALIGVEAIVALADVGGYDRQATLDALEWAAAALVRHSLRPAHPE